LYSHCFPSLFIIPCKSFHHFHSLSAPSSPTLQANRQSRQCPGIATPCKAGGRQRKRIVETRVAPRARRPQPARPSRVNARLARPASLSLAWPVLSHTLLSHHSLKHSSSPGSSLPVSVCPCLQAANGSVLFHYCRSPSTQQDLFTAGPPPTDCRIAPASKPACLPACLVPSHPRPRATRQHSRGITLTARQRLCLAHLINTLAPPHKSPSHHLASTYLAHTSDYL
jgi:hypothetical protein